jgi:putative spermidine/putrescine transport system permease protein
VSVLAVRKLQRFNLLDIPQGYAIAVLYTIFVFILLVFLFKVKSRQ